MNWEKEWNELLIAENILVRYKNMTDQQQRLDFLNYQKKNISGELSRVFYKLWEAHVYGKDRCDWVALQKDIYLAHKIIQKGAVWNLKQWEYMELRIQQKEPFHTIWGESFYESLQDKIRLEKRAEKRAKKKKQRKNVRKQKQKNTRGKWLNGSTIAVAFFGVVSLAFLSVWLYQTVKSDQRRYRLAEEQIALTQRQIAEAKENAKRNALEQEDGLTFKTQMEVTSAESITAVSEAALEQEKEPELLEVYQPFLEQYGNLYGWLRVDGTSIDYPVMRPKGKMEADYYLDHSYEGEEAIEGALFVDRECKLKPRSQNIVIYGHNMRNGEMFGALMRYEDSSFLAAHNQIEFDTIYETGEYEIIAVLLTRVLNENEQGFRYYQLFDFKKVQDYESCQQFINQNLAYGKPVELHEGDELLMLSTCEYSQENGRLVVVARRK